MTQEEGIRYSVVIPVYKNRATLADVVDRLVALRDGREGGLEGVFVVDGSPDDSLGMLHTLLSDGRVDAQVISLSRNFGSFSAIRAGIRVARGDFLAVMAADLQEPIEVALGIFDALESGQCEIAIGERTGRDDPALSTAAARLYWWLYRRFVNSEIPPGGVDVFGCTRSVAQRLVAVPETHTSLIGLLYWMGFRRSHVPYRRTQRTTGKSEWTMRRKLRYLFDSVYAFTDLPIILLQIIGLFGVVGSVLVGLVVFVAWLIGAVRQPGYTPLMIVILASTSALLLGLGVVGSYVWRAYENGKNRPHELVASHELYGPRAGVQ